jgi:8-oxo-dGTP pyrophosphatase MutT (NUDIX family)
MKTIASFEVGLKAFLVRHGRLLLVRERVAPQLWELPGGRFDEGEEMTSTSVILARELGEELGSSLRWDLVGLRDTWVRLAPERGTHVFLLGFECRWLDGEIVLSDEHVESQWVERDDWRGLPLAEPYPEVLERFWTRGPNGAN